MSRVIRDRMSVQDKSLLTPGACSTPRRWSASSGSSLGTSQLSQFMDQINPLAEITHKRRFSALGPGGLNRKRAGFEVRDVHYTHYGRICPIETPEGPNIGLITSLATYAQINDFGLIESPYRKVVKGKTTGESGTSAPTPRETRSWPRPTPRWTRTASTPNTVYCRSRGDFPVVRTRPRVDYMDISPMQVVSVSAALIPFPRARRRQPRAHGLEHAAAGRPPAQRRAAAGRHRHRKEA